MMKLGCSLPIDNDPGGFAGDYCLECGHNAKLELWKNYLSYFVGECYLCQHCGMHGYLCDEDAPVTIKDNILRLENEPDKVYCDRIIQIRRQRPSVMVHPFPFAVIPDESHFSRI